MIIARAMQEQEWEQLERQFQEIAAAHDEDKLLRFLCDWMTTIEGLSFTGEFSFSDSTVRPRSQLPFTLDGTWERSD